MTTTTSSNNNINNNINFHDVQEQANRLYRGKGLAPMVRASTTPLRTLALEYGADFVYTEELIDKSLGQTLRQENNNNGNSYIDYVKDVSQLSLKSQKKLARENRPCLVLRIDPSVEQSKIICQLGTGDPEGAVTAARHVYRDVAGIDINMGCPKPFSVSGGMGSALLNDPDRAVSILRRLREEIPRPISCKIRLLPGNAAMETVTLVQRLIDEGGVNAVAIHARRVADDDATIPADWTTLELVMTQLRAIYPSFPFLLNGDFYDRAEMEEMLSKTKASGILLGRPALYNTSIFRPLGTPLQDKTKVIQRYLQHAAKYDQHFKNPKYVVCEMMNNRRAPTPRVPFLPQVYEGGQTIAKTCHCKNLEQIFAVWNLAWNGTGNKNTTDTTTALSPGDHRYDDSYFLGNKRRPAEGEEDCADVKRVKSNNQEYPTNAAKTTTATTVQEEKKE